MKKNISSQGRVFDWNSPCQKVLKSLFTVFLLLCSLGVWGQILGWQFGNPVSIGDETLFTATTVDVNLNSSSLSRGNGIKAIGLARAFSSNDFSGSSSAAGTKSQAISLNEYYQFTVTAKASYKVSLSTIDAILRRSSAGPNAYIWMYSLDGTNFTEIGTEVSFISTSDGVTQSQIDLSAITALQNVLNTTTITFRLYAWGASTTNAASGTFAIGRYASGATTNSLSVGGSLALATSTPTVTTTVANAITITSADSGGNVTANGGAPVSARGVFFGTTAAPTTGTSETGTTGVFISSLSSLSINTQYYYRAYATNSQGTGYGTESSFFTLANIPSAVTIATPTSTSLNVSVNANGNPASTEYAIHETGGNFVQANGSLGVTAVWQTAATWGTKAVIGLSTATTYTFEIKARNGANVETVYSGSASGTTDADQVVDFNKIQFPVTEETITVGGTLDVYTRAYEPGLTTNSGAQASLKGWVGYSSTNDNPANAGWTWVAATFNAEYVDDDEYKATLSGLPLGTYYYAGRFQIGTGSYAYGGADTVWNNNSVKLNVAPDVVDYCNIQSPFTGNITEGINFDIYAQVYEDGITNPAGQGAGITAQIGYSTTNGAPDNSWTWLPATYNTDGTGANANNDEYKTTFSGLAPGIYYYASRFKKSGSSVYKYGGIGGVWNNDSGVLTVNPDLVEWGNYQSPTIGTYTTGGIYDVYGRVRVPGVTPGAGQGAGITAEVGYNTTNTNPKTVGWTWVAAQYNALGPTGTEDEYMHNMGAELNATGTYYLAFRYKKFPSDTWYYAGHGATPNSGGAWDGTSNVNAEVTVIAKSTASDIVVKSGYTYPQNIPYANYQATNITGGTNDIEIAKFTIRDGGATADADNLGTSLSQLVLNVSNNANIRRIALYDGVTEIAEQAGAATNTFNTLNLVAPDNGTKDFSVRVSFNTTVTDNQQIQLTIATTTSASATGSTFAATNAGGATTSVVLDDNRIEVTADRLAFTTQPTNTGISAAMSNVVVSTTDINNNTDLDWAGTSVSLTSSGTMTGSSLSAVFSSGKTTFTGITHTAAGTNFKLTAATTGLTVSNIILSTSFDITTFSTGDYQSLTDGTWSSTVGASTSTWSQFNGTSWDSSAAPATNAASLGTKTVYILNNVSLRGTNTAPNVVIDNGGTLHTFTITPTFGNITIKAGGSFSQDGYTKINGTLEVFDGGVYIYNSKNTSSRSSSIWQGSEKFHPNSTFKIINSDTGGTYNIIESNADVDVFLNPLTGYSACFGNVIINNPAGSAFQFLPANFSKNIAHGNITFTSNASNKVFLAGSTNSGIGGNFIVDATYNQTITFLTADATANFTVKGDLINNSNKIIRLANTSGITNLNVDGNITLNNGSLDINFASSSSGTINLKGNLMISATSTLFATSSPATFNFNGLGDGSSAALMQTIDIANAATASNIVFNVSSGSYTKLINQSLSLGTNSKFNVLTGGTIDFGFNGINPIDIVNNGNTTVFDAKAGSILKITSPIGITKTATGSSGGNVQTAASAAGRVFDPGATYHYIGKVSQSTGDALPQGLANKLIVELDTDSTLENLSFTSVGSTKFNSLGTLEIRKGKVIDIPFNGFRNNIAVENEDGELDAQKGNIVMTGGRYVVSGSGTKPSLSGAYTFSAGTLEFTGTAATKIRTSSPPKQYYNVDVSGTNVETGGKNFIVNNLLKITSPDAVLTIPETPLDSDNPYVVTAKNGLHVLAGKALFKNNANLMQETAANNIGNITMDRKTKMVKMDYTYWSSPVAGQRLTNTINPNLETSSGGFSPGTPNSRIFEYVEATDLFKATSDANFVAGKGYAIRGKNSFGTTPTIDIFQFEGNPNNGNSISFNITKSPNSTIGGVSYEHGYNIIGNPYPSNINFAKFYDLNKAVINAKVWYWTNASPHLYMEGSTYNGNNYATVTLAGGVPPTYIPSSGNYKPTNIIKVGQGFIIQAKAVPTSVQQNFTINFNNDIREAGVGVFYNNVGKSEPENRYWLRMKSPSDIVNTILIGHIPNATDGYDANYDAELFTLGDDSLYSILEERKLQIQAKGDFQEASQFILGTQFSHAGIYRFELEDPEGVFANEQSIYLYDKLKNTYTNLSQNSYQFETGKGKTEGRFEIVYKPGATLVTDNRVKGLVQVYRSGDYFVVKSSDSKIEEIEIYDATGRLYQQVKGGTEEVKIDAAPLTNGLYVLKIKRKNETISKKIIK